MRLSLRIDYRQPGCDELPHIVKMSGGRSSAMMALSLAADGALRAERGDVILFANTSAEHPRTYEFADRVSGALEGYGLPVLWYEFCTVEDARLGSRHRRLSYRLVNRSRWAPANPDGYRSDGSVFEEMLSWKRCLPDPRARFCTVNLKLLPAHLLLDEWLDHTSSGPRSDGSAEPCLTADGVVSGYRGAMPEKELRAVSAAMLAAPARRLAQRWDRFTTGSVARPGLADRGYAPLRAGRRPARYVTLMGLRADEARRVQRVLSRSLFAEGAGSAKCQIATQPPGEMPLCPLHDSAIGKAEVLEFWRNRPPVEDLGLDDTAGNCVFCFMKGAGALARLNRAAPVADQERGTPVDIGWWEDIERTYRRVIPARDPQTSGKKTATFGFLGIGRESYAQIRAGNTPLTAPRHDKRQRVSVGAAACDCTD